MGAWGTGTFENDDALDWTYELEEVDDDSVLQEALKAIVDHGDVYLEAYDSCRALAAAEVIAALKNAGSSNLPSEVSQWTDRHQIETIALTQMAIIAVQRIKINSELKELWDESGSIGEWNDVVNDLEARLKR